jgi:hypothetical protein
VNLGVGRTKRYRQIPPLTFFVFNKNPFMNLKKKDGHIQGKSAIIKRGNKYTQILEVLFNEGVKLSGGNALLISKILTDNNIDHV